LSLRGELLGPGGEESAVEHVLELGEVMRVHLS
jgi:hypothetical protein